MIGETLHRATAATTPAPDDAARGGAARRPPAPAAGPREYAALAADPLAVWVEDTFGLDAEPGTGRLVRRSPTTVPLAAGSLAEATGLDAERCAAAIRATLLAGSQARHPQTGRPLFAFRLHQFLSKGDTVYVSLEPEDDPAHHRRLPAAGAG